MSATKCTSPALRDDDFFLGQPRSTGKRLFDVFPFEVGVLAQHLVLGRAVRDLARRSPMPGILIP
jgi:hypothetical protein